jgi:type IV pilus assembly protein PilB
MSVEELLKQAGLNPSDIAKILERAAQTSPLGAIEESKLMTEEQALGLFSKFYKVTIANLEKMDIPRNVIQLIPTDVATKARIIPIDRVGNNIIVATSNPEHLQTAVSLKFKTGYAFKAVLATEARISEALDKYYNPSNAQTTHKTKPPEKKKIVPAVDSSRVDISVKRTQDGPVIQVVNEMLLACVEKGGSDIHVEPYETTMRVRLRVDGTLEEIMTPSLNEKDAITSRIKIIAGLDIAEKRLPQDGGIRVAYKGRPIDFRVNSLPTIYGEKIVMRILDKSALQVDMTALGFDKNDLERFMSAIHQPHGMVLVTGPTGSGKTTTLYSALAELNKTTENIMTAEDPVEYNLEGINQVQVKADIGLDFASALRAFLRQDPDVIMVGEIRDLTTAEIAIKAALTGHMVLSTLHTNAAVETIIRIQNMGVEAFNIASALNAVIAQRLARKICTSCKIVDELITPEVLITMGIHPNYATKVKAYKGAGCDECGQKGNKGRVALHEVMLMTDPLRTAVLTGASAIEMKQIAMQGGMRTLRQAALAKMVQGLISSSEVIKVSAEESSEEGESKAA